MNEYRILHSQVIEQYQLIEFHLEGLVAIMQSNGKNFLELAKRVENDAMGELIRKVQFLIKELNYRDILTFNDFSVLDRIRDDRNFYCHENFLINKSKNYELKESKKIKDDLAIAINMNKVLKKAFEIIKKTK